MPREKRWLILTPDGGHVSIGRDTDRSDDEIEAVAGQLRVAGSGGWLAVMEGHYYEPGVVTLLNVRQVVPAPGSWDDAVSAFERRRRDVIMPLRKGQRQPTQG